MTRKQAWACLALWFTWSFQTEATETVSKAGEEIRNIIQAGDLTQLQALAKKDPALLQFKDDRGRTLLHGAAAVGQVEMARWLIAKGAEVDSRTAEMSTPLMAAALSGKPNMVRLLIAKGADLSARNSYQRTAFILVGRETGNTDMAAILLDAGADINAVDRFNDSALSLAAWRGFAGLVNLLLERGAKLPADPGQKQQLFTLAIANGLDALFDRILALGADLSARDNLGGNLLHAAADGGSAHILNALIGKNLDPNLRDSNGWTPLHRAAERGRAGVAALLIEHGARLDERTLAGETPYNLAVAENNADVAARLKSRGADLGPPRFPELKGEYLGQKKPGAKPEIFAPGIVSSRFGMHCTAAFSPDGREVYWNLMVEPRIPGYTISRLLFSRLQNGRWTYPQVAPFTEEGKDADVPFFSPDGKRLYFMSRRPLPPAGESSGEHIWFMEQQGKGWTEARPVDDTVNRLPHHWQFSLDSSYNLYFSTTIADGKGQNDIYCAKYVDGHYTTPQNLGGPVNTPQGEEMPFIAPDGSYLLFAREMDLFVSFRQTDGGWSEPQNLGPQINTPSIDVCPMISADGKYLFFLSQRGGESHTWWVEAGAIHDLKPKSAALPATTERAEVEKTIRDNIGWALTKDRPLLESTMARDERLLIVNPDSEITAGWEQFVKNFDFWLDPRFKATGLDIRDLRIELSPLGDAAWWSCILDDLYEWDGKAGAWKDTRWTGVLEKRDSRWRIVQMHFSFAADKVAAAVKAKLALDEATPAKSEKNE